MLEDFVANRESETVMQDRALCSLFGRAIEQEQRRIVSLVPIVGQCTDGANKTNMIAAIMLDFGCSEPTARKMLDRSVDQKLVQVAADHFNANRQLFGVPEDVQIKIQQIEQVMPIITAVVVKQTSAPSDFEAGRELLPENFSSIYFNARDPKEAIILRNAITVLAQKIKESKKCPPKKAA